MEKIYGIYGSNIWGKKTETVTDFIFLGSKITADAECSLEIKRCLLLGRKAMTNLDSELKRRDMTLLTKIHIVKAMVFPVVMYGCESWTVKKAEHWRNDAFELWCCRRFLKVPWTTKRSNQSILKEISLEYSLGTDDEAETPILWLPDARIHSLEQTLMLGKIEGRRRGQQMMSWLDGIIDSMNMSLSRLWELAMDGSPACCRPWGRKEWDTTEWLNWIERNIYTTVPKYVICNNNMPNWLFHNMHLKISRK